MRKKNITEKNPWAYTYKPIWGADAKEIHWLIPKKSV